MLVIAGQPSNVEHPNASDDDDGESTKVNLSGELRPSSGARRGPACEAPACGGEHRGAYAATAGSQDGHIAVRLVSLQAKDTDEFSRVGRCGARRGYKGEVT